MAVDAHGSSYRAMQKVNTALLAVFDRSQDSVTRADHLLQRRVSIYPLH